MVEVFMCQTVETVSNVGTFLKLGQRAQLVGKVEAVRRSRVVTVSERAPAVATSSLCKLRVRVRVAVPSCIRIGITFPWKFRSMKR